MSRADEALDAWAARRTGRAREAGDRRAALLDDRERALRIRVAPTGDAAGAFRRAYRRHRHVYQQPREVALEEAHLAARAAEQRAEAVEGSGHA